MAGTAKSHSRRMKKKKYPKCPTPKKIKYYNVVIAYRALTRLQNQGIPGHNESRVYKCPSGSHYHLTSM